jgi:hypothetical protein
VAAAAGALEAVGPEALPEDALGSELELPQDVITKPANARINRNVSFFMNSCEG